ncbi:MAG: DNA topoisomerase, partial [Lentisphaerota bacterium]
VPEKPNIYKSKSSAQEAHEAIRPTMVSRAPDDVAALLQPDELKLYRIIWQRFVSSQMAPARIAQRTVEVEAVPPAGKTSTYLFRASASQVVFPGYMKVSGGEEKRKDENGDEVESLPPLREGEPLECLEWLKDQKFTTPPPRYSEASLVKALEENGVGRPSTYAQILSTLVNRTYVEKEKRQLKPTTLGTNVNTFLVAHLNELFDVNFTAGMENSLDEIEQGSIEWTSMLGDFYKKFLGWMAEVNGPDATPEMVRKILEVLAHIKEWGPETKRGKRVYSDGKYVESIREQLAAAEKPISARQMEALKKLLIRYRQQVPAYEAVEAEWGLKELEAQSGPAPEPASPATLRKLELLKTIKFNEPRTVGKKVYDDSKFSESLRQQVEGGRGLSVNQISYLDRLVLKYAEQIPDLEKEAEALGLVRKEGDDPVSGPLLEALKAVKEWKPAVMRGRREWDDKKFFESLSRQFGERRQLSEKQAASLKKLVKRYAAQVEGYDKLAETYGLPQVVKREAGEEAS